MPNTPDLSSLMLQDLERRSMIELCVAQTPFDESVRAALLERILADPVLSSLAFEQIPNFIRAHAQAVFDERTSIPSPVHAPHFRAVFTGKMDPPTRSHIAILDHMVRAGIPVVAGPDAERSGSAPWIIRRFLFREILLRDFPDLLDSGRVQEYPEFPNTRGLDFQKRIEALRASFPDAEEMVFSCGADTLNVILEVAPDTVLAAPILCMRRASMEGASISVPVVDEALFCGFIRRFFHKNYDLLVALFQGHACLGVIELWGAVFQGDDFSTQIEFLKKNPSERFIERLLDSERIHSRSHRVYEDLRDDLSRFSVHSRLATDPFALKLLQAHIFYIDAPESVDSSTRDRYLISALKDAPKELLLDRENTLADESVEEIHRFVTDRCQRMDWTSLAMGLHAYMERAPLEAIAAIRRMVNVSTLEVLLKYDLLDLYDSNPQISPVALPEEVLERPRFVAPEVAVLDPQDIDRLSPPSQFHVARSIAGFEYVSIADHPDPAVYNAARLFKLMARQDDGRKFRPSILFDTRTREIIAVLPAFRIKPHVLKHLPVVVNPSLSRERGVVDLVDGFVRHRMQRDLVLGDNGASVILAEVPAHRTRFVEQHLLGGSTFIPAGLEPTMDESRQKLIWSVQGIHLRNPKFNQGTYYCVDAAVPLIKSVNSCVSAVYERTIRYGLRTSIPSPKSMPVLESDVVALPIRRFPSGESCVPFQVGAFTFAIYPERSRHLDPGDFLNHPQGVGLLRQAVAKAFDLHKQGRFPRPYLKIALPINDRASLPLQRVLMELNFKPVRFIPATQHTPPTLTFCCVLGAPAMNEIQLPFRSPGLNPQAAAVFGVLQTLADDFSTFKMEEEDRATGIENAIQGHRRMGRNRSLDFFVKEEAAWPLFDSLYGHYEEVSRAFSLYRKYAGGRYKEQFRSRNLEDFVRFHDVGKNLWVVARAFVRFSHGREITPDTLKNEILYYLSHHFDQEESPTPDWRSSVPVESLANNIAQVLIFDESSSSYRVPPDICISAFLLRKFSPETHRHVALKRTFSAVSTLYEKIGSGDLDVYWRRGLVDSFEVAESLSRAWVNPDVFAHFLLELIDNTARYELVNEDGSLSLRNVKIALELKLNEVLAKYGDDEATSFAIRSKFRLLEEFATNLVATDPPHSTDS